MTEGIAMTWPIGITKVSRTYNGKTGCACGCGGEYTEDGDTESRAVKLRVSKINANMESAVISEYLDEDIYELVSEDGERVTRVYVYKPSTPKFIQVEAREGDHIIIVVGGKPVGVVISTAVREQTFNKFFDFTAHGLNVGLYPDNTYISSIASGGTIAPLEQTVESVIEEVTKKYKLEK